MWCFQLFGLKTTQTAGSAESGATGISVGGVCVEVGTPFRSHHYERKLDSCFHKAFKVDVMSFTCGKCFKVEKHRLGNNRLHFLCS